MSKRVFIIGSGFSRPAGLPTSNELLDIAVQNPLMLEDDDFNRWRKHLSEIIKELEPDNGLNIEQFFDYAQFDVEFWKMKNQISPSDDGESERKQSWLNDITKEVYLIISKKQKEAEEKNKIKYIINFANQLTAQDTIVTFNYDTLVESIFKRLNIKWDHGLDDFVEQNISVLKMHGSIDWIILKRGTLKDKPEKFQKLYSRYDIYVREQNHTPADKPEYIWELWRHTDTYAIPAFSESPISSFQYGLGHAGLGRFKRLSMLPGSYLSWHEAGSALYNADEVYVIGFSMTQYDLMCRMYFLDVIQKRIEDNRKPIKLTLIDPQAPKIEGTFRQVFKPADMKVIAESIGDDTDWGELIN